MNRDEILIAPHRKSKLIYFIFLGVILVILSISSFFIYLKSYSNTLPLPVSKTVANSLGFDIYYPKQSLLPSGYHLDINSFDPGNQTLIYSLSNSGNTKIIISEQSKPSDQQLKIFYSKDMPLYSIFQTTIGTAALGAISSRNVISLPTNTSTWILITAPRNTNTDSLKAVAMSIRLAQNHKFFFINY